MSNIFWNWSSRLQKREVRDYQLIGRPKKRAIFLPGWDLDANDGCFDIQKALETGLINRSTHIFAVEREEHLAPFIDKKLNDLKLDYTMHHGPLATLDIEGANIDFAYFDFLGCLDEPTSYWMNSQLVQNMADNADLSFTMAYSFRANRFMKICDEAFKTTYAEQSRWADNYYDIPDRHVLLYILILRSIFNGLDFEYRMAQKYQDNVASMIAYRMENFRPATNLLLNGELFWPSLDDLLQKTKKHQLKFS